MGLFSDVMSRLRAGRGSVAEIDIIEKAPRAPLQFEDDQQNAPDAARYSGERASPNDKTEARLLRVQAKVAELSSTTRVGTGAISSEEGPFIAWSSAPEEASSAAFRISCEKHVRATQAALAKHIGAPAIEGIVFYDTAARGKAVVSLLSDHDQTLPFTSNGQSCATELGEDALSNRASQLNYFYGGSEEASGMMIEPIEGGSRLFIAIHQRAAALMHPVGAKENPDTALKAIGTLAHEMGHARDAADGRPGVPSREEVAAHVLPDHVDAVHTLAASTLSEYIGTRSECLGQVALRGACSPSATRHSVETSATWKKINELHCPESEGRFAVDSHRIELPITGYVLGTLAGYAHADAPLVDTEGRPSTQRTSDVVWENVQKDSAFGVLISQVAPALERAAVTPNAETRGALAKSIESSFQIAKEAERAAEKAPKRDISLRGQVDER